MKQYLVYFGLFLTFVAALSAVKYLDAYSQHYVNCAQKWDKSVKMAEGQSALTGRMLEILETTELTHEGKACPALRPDHAEIVRSRLVSNTRP